MLVSQEAAGPVPGPHLLHLDVPMPSALCKVVRPRISQIIRFSQLITTRLLCAKQCLPKAGCQKSETQRAQCVPSASQKAAWGTVSAQPEPGSSPHVMIQDGVGELPEEGEKHAGQSEVRIPSGPKLKVLVGSKII